jgi:hypothetical protein
MTKENINRTKLQAKLIGNDYEVGLVPAFRLPPEPSMIRPAAYATDLDIASLMRFAKAAGSFGNSPSRIMA